MAFFASTASVGTMTVIPGSVRITATSSSDCLEPPAPPADSPASAPQMLTFSEP